MYKRRFFRLARISAVVLAVSAPLAADEIPPITIGVSPPRFEVKIGTTPVNQAIKVFNFGESRASIEVFVYDWELDDENKIKLLGPTEQSLDQWMIINPLRFTVEPGDFQTVRFSIRPKVQPEIGEHRALIYFQQKPPEGPAALKIVGRVGVAIYGYAGAVHRVGELNGVDIRSDDNWTTAVFDVSSLGTAHVRMTGQYAVWPAADYPGVDQTHAVEDPMQESTLPASVLEAGRLPTLPVLPDSRRRLGLTLTRPLPPGNYVLDINGELSGTPLTLGLPFVVGASHVAQGAPE